MELILKITLAGLVVVLFVFFVLPIFQPDSLIPDSFLPVPFISDLLRGESYEESIERWSEDRKECDIIKNSGAPIYEFNRCVLEYTQKALEICEEHPEAKERCDDVKEFVRNNPETSFLLD